MQHWRTVLPKAPFEVAYEDLVADHENVSRQIVAFVNLPWDSACLNFHDNRRAIQTMSKMQVRQPIYRSSVGRCKRYENQLQPLLIALEKIYTF
jgi:Sulfotransferase family